MAAAAQVGAGLPTGCLAAAARMGAGQPPAGTLSLLAAGSGQGVRSTAATAGHGLGHICMRRVSLANASWSASPHARALQSAAAHRLHPEESEVAELVHRAVAAEAGGREAEAAAEAIIEACACKARPRLIRSTLARCRRYVCCGQSLPAAASSKPFGIATRLAAGGRDAGGTPATAQAPTHSGGSAPSRRLAAAPTASAQLGQLARWFAAISACPVASSARQPAPANDPVRPRTCWQPAVQASILPSEVAVLPPTSLPPLAASELERLESQEGRPHERHSLASLAQARSGRSCLRGVRTLWGGAGLGSATLSSFSKCVSALTIWPCSLQPTAPPTAATLLWSRRQACIAWNHRVQHPSCRPVQRRFPQ